MPISWHTVIFKFRSIFATDERRIMSGIAFHYNALGNPVEPCFFCWHGSTQNPPFRSLWDTRYSAKCQRPPRYWLLLLIKVSLDVSWTMVHLAKSASRWEESSRGRDHKFVSFWKNDFLTYRNNICIFFESKKNKTINTVRSGLMIRHIPHNLDNSI